VSGPLPKGFRRKDPKRRLFRMKTPRITKV
jgi:hypothetical protein